MDTEVSPYSQDNTVINVVFKHRGKTYAHASSSAISGLHVGFLLSALRCFEACCCESEPQMKEKRTTKTKRYVDNNLLQLLVLEMGLLEI